MNVRKLSLLLMLAGVALLLLSIVWFFVAYASTLDTMSRYGDKDVTMQMMACIYSSPPICQGAAFLSDSPAYSPVVFWLGVILLLGGIIVFFALNKQITSASNMAGSTDQSNDSEALLGFIAKDKYTRYAYVLFLVGAAGGLLLPPLAVAALAGFILAVLGYFVFPQQLTLLDKNHLASLSLVYVVSILLLFLTIGSALFLLVALLQLVVYYIGFNSFRLGRLIDTHHLKEEAVLAFKPLRERFSQTPKP